MDRIVEMQIVRIWEQTFVYDDWERLKFSFQDEAIDSFSQYDCIKMLKVIFIDEEEFNLLENWFELIDDLDWILEVQSKIIDLRIKLKKEQISKDDIEVRRLEKEKRTLLQQKDV